MVSAPRHRSGSRIALVGGAGGLAVGGAVAMVSGVISRSHLKADVESGTLAVADAESKATGVNVLLGIGYGGLAAGAGLGLTVVAFASVSTAGIHGGIRW